MLSSSEEYTDIISMYGIYIQHLKCLELGIISHPANYAQMTVKVDGEVISSPTVNITSEEAHRILDILQKAIENFKEPQAKEDPLTTLTTQINNMFDGTSHIQAEVFRDSTAQCITKDTNGFYIADFKESQ